MHHDELENVTEFISSSYRIYKYMDIHDPPIPEYSDYSAPENLVIENAPQ